jgi:hypothetical protein
MNPLVFRTNPLFFWMKVNRRYFKWSVLYANFNLMGILFPIFKSFVSILKQLNYGCEYWIEITNGYVAKWH